MLGFLSPLRNVLAAAWQTAAPMLPMLLWRDMLLPLLSQPYVLAPQLLSRTVRIVVTCLLQSYY